jgi:hypothetical protein
MSIGGIKFYNVSGHTGTSSIYLSTNNYLETNQIITSQIGFNAGLTGQGTGAVAFGYQAGESNQSAGALAFGYKAGQTSQGTGSIAIGYLAGQTNESANAVAIGNNAGQTSQGTGSIAIGSGAGQTNESANAVAIGNNAGQTSQGTGSIAIGYLAGQTNEGTNAVAIGNNAGQISQGTGSIAIGYLAGQNNQGTNSIAVGNLAGPTGMKANSIALNASGVPLHATGPTGGFYVNPIADYTNSLTIGNTGYFKLMMYGTDNQVVNIDPNDLPYPITNVKKTLENNTFKIAYDYPYQFLGGPFYLPFITTLNIEIKADTPSNFPSNFKDLPLTIQDRSSFSIKTPSNLNVVTNIYIFNTSTQYTNFNVLNQNAINHGPGPGSSGYIYYIYIPPAICNNSTLSLSIWYSNGNGDGVKTNIPAINLIQTVYSPAAPVVGINGTVLSYLPPDSLELSNQMVTYTLTDAFQNYKTNTDIRFNTSNNPPTQNKNNYTLTKPTYDIFNELGLTPESLYNITVNAIGSIQGNSSTKTTTTSLSITTPIFTPNFYSDIMKINGASKTGTTINIPVSNLGSTTDKAKSFQTNLEDYIEKVPLFISFSMPTIYLQNNISKRGNLSGTNDLMTVSLTCNRTNGERFTIGPFAINATSNQTGTFEGASIVGFGSSKPSFDYTITDSQTLPNLQGFYKNISFHVVIPDDTMTSSLTVTYSNDNCDPTTFNTVVFNYGTDASLDYVYDGPYSLPTIDFTASTITIDPSTILNQVCGISVANASPTLTFNSTLKNVSNIGKYYYNTNQIILYSFTTTPSSGSVTLTNTSLTTIDQPLTNTSYFTIDNNGNYHINQGIQISKTITTNISSNLYFQQIKVNTALYNPINDIGSYNFVLPIIYDTISLRSTLRVTSVNAGNELVRPNSSVSIIEPFDNTAFLTGTNELLYTNGMYVTPGLDSPEKYYIDYSNTYYGTNVPNPNYTSIVTNETNPRSTIYRYATFPYNVTNLVGIISCSFSRINITINNTSREIFSDSNNIIYINNSKLLLFYRIQIDQIPVNNGIGPLNPYANIPDNNGSTNWVDCNQRGNDLNIIETTVSTDNDTGLYTYGYPNFIFDSTNNVSNNISPTTAIIQRNLPYQMNPIPPKSTSNFTPSYNIIIFLRIGVPMNVPFSFTDISIQLIN